MLKIVFVCLGNICRSPMAELIFKNLIEKENIANLFDVTSSATSNYEIGEPIYPPAARELAKHNITGYHTAKKISKSELDSDFILVMDSSNYRDICNIDGVKRNNVFKLCDFTDNPRDVADPWYTNNFTTAYNDILDGCTAFLRYLKTNNLIK